MQKKKIRSAIPIYGVAVLWLLLGLICPRLLLKIGFLLFAAAASAGVYLGLSRVFPGREVEVRESAHSGNRDVDEMIENGRKQLDSIRESNAAIPDPAITRNLDRIVNAGEAIFAVLEKNTSKASIVRKFMNYYLPTADKLMQTYRTLLTLDSQGENIAHTMTSVENSLGMIVEAFEKQLDNLYKDHALDIETDIEVLETMMAGDGLIGKGSFEDRSAGIPELTLNQTAQTGR